jgi:hypothetical protein
VVGERFYLVDLSLKRLCGELRRIGEPITEVTRRI